MRQHSCVVRVSLLLQSRCTSRFLPQTIFVLAAFFCISCLTAGCSRSEQQMKVPDIKIITMENVHGVMAADDNSVWITGNYGIIYHTADGGKKWEKQISGVKDYVLVDGVFLDPMTGWVVGIGGTVLHTTDAGHSWIQQNTGTKRHLFGISFPDKNKGWAVGERGAIIHTTDGGATWQKQGEELDRTLNNVVFLDKDTGWIVGERGVILHTTDGGATWNSQVPKLFEREDIEAELENPPPNLYGVFFTDKDHGWACGIDGTLIKTGDGGATWSLLPPVTQNTLYTVFIKFGKGWVVGDKGAYLMSEDGGATWQLQQEVIKSKQAFRDIFFSSPTNGWAVGGAGSVIHTTDGGKTWTFCSGLSYAMEFFEMPPALEFKGMVTE